MISSCGLLCLAFYNRLDALVTRLRAFHRERLREQESLVQQRSAAQPDPIAIIKNEELLGVLQVQTDLVARRVRTLRLALFCLLLTIACLSLCSLAMGLLIVWPGCVYVAVPLFVVGLLLLVAAVVFAMVEMKHALHSIEQEGRFVTSLIEDLEAGRDAAATGQSAARRLGRLG